MSRMPSPWVRTCATMGLSGREHARHHEPGPALLQEVAHPIAAPGLRTGVADEVEAERGGEEAGEGPRVADPPLEVVDATEARAAGTAVIARHPPRGRPTSRPRTPGRHPASGWHPCANASTSTRGCANASSTSSEVWAACWSSTLSCHVQRERQALALASLEGLEPGDELLPEPRRRPVLDGIARALGDRCILCAVDLEELVAEQRRSGSHGDACRDRRSPGPGAPRTGAATRSTRHRSGTSRRRRCPPSPPDPGRCLMAWARRPR